jgi:hypothetical protein
MLGPAFLFSFGCSICPSLTTLFATAHTLFSLVTISITGGSKVLEFYEAFAKQRATLLRADGKDILSVRMVLNVEKEC